MNNPIGSYFDKSVCLIAALCLLLIAAGNTYAQKKYAIAIHGGAGSSPDRFSNEANQRRRESMEKALTIGKEILEKGGSSLDAVEAVVVFLENDPQFNAGKGAVFNSEGGFELDASIMDGSNLKCGAVAGVQTIKNPIKLARKVMTETRHILLACDGAEKFGQSMGVDIVENDYFSTPRTKRAWERQQRRPDDLPVSLDDLVGSYQGTVGCVALDNDGNLAAATSTGGLSNKKYGRVGDTPIVGAGTYANNSSCAVSGTGIGEQFMRNAIGYDVSARFMYLKEDLKTAVEHQLTKVLNKNEGGIIAVSKDGDIVMDFNTSGMARAAADSDGRFEVIWGDDSE